MKKERNILAELEKWNGVPVYEKCVKHCHAKQVHSLVLSELEDGRLLRVFVAMEGNELYKNDYRNEEVMSVGYHNHRYDLELMVLKGSLTNYVVSKRNDGINLNSYGYQTGLQQGIGQPRISFISSVCIGMDRVDHLFKDDQIYLEANEVHSISTSKSEFVAWIILEGEGSSNYSAELYTNDLLEESSTADLYKTITKQEVDELLQLVFRKNETT